MGASLYEHCVKATILLVSEFLLSLEQDSITLLSFEFFYKHMVLRFKLFFPENVYVNTEEVTRREL